MPTNSCAGGAMERATQMKQSNVSWVGADFSQFKRLQIFFPLGELVLSLVTPFMFPYPDLQWSKNLIQQHLCQHSPFCLPQTPRSCTLNITHTSPDPAEHTFKFQPVKKFISFNRPIKRFKVKYIRNCFPESNPK